MKRFFFILILAVSILTFYSCACNCIHCPGMSATTGSDDVCKAQYDTSANGHAPTMTWQTYSDNLIGMGSCSCK